MNRYFCCDLRRLEVIKLSGTANGIEFLEVRDHLEPTPGLRQRTLFLRLLRPGFVLSADNILIDGGERLPVVPVEWAAAGDALPAGTDPALVDGIADLTRTLVVRTAVFGDFSRYTLHLRASSGSDEPPAGFDPKLSEIEFSFKVECPSDYDCAATTPCPTAAEELPGIDYLAKDYPGLRRLMLDRLNLLAPGWTERSAADVGVTLVELLAYAADNLSYRQDAIANEAYLGTAHRRISVRRHARLVDYALHEGCNARAWVQIAVNADQALPRGTPLLTRTGVLKAVQVPPASKALSDTLAAGALVFETVVDAMLFADLNALSIYTWGDLGCCLPRGATSATLRGLHPDLKPGDVLVLQEVISPSTYEAPDADRDKRWAVRLTTVTASVDPSGGLFDEPPNADPVEVTEIEWAPADALPFPLCISVQERPGLAISMALGNIVLADHGQTVASEALGSMPAATLKRVPVAAGAGSCQRAEGLPIPPRFRPLLAQAPLTHGFAAAAAAGPASQALQRDPHEALPQIRLSGKLGAQVSAWSARGDLLSSDADATDFVAEITDEGIAQIRFGDGTLGRRPDTGTAFEARYRVGNGVAGNVGAEAIGHIVSTVSGVFASISNWLPAGGGIEPEDVEAARRDAPEAFRTQQRAVTAADYAEVAERRADVQQAAASFRWTGSWHTVFVTADRRGGLAVDADFSATLRAWLERFRMAGYDLAVDAPRSVALDVALHVCVRDGYLRSDVLRALRAELGTGVLPDGRLAVFHPDQFTFGQPVYLSRIVAAAQAVPGVEAVWPTKFQRMASPDPSTLETGVIAIGRLEIAQLANNPNFRERGRLVIEVGGGQ